MRFSLFAPLACLAVSHASKYHKITDDWSFDVDEGQNADWMGTIADGTPLSSLSIPGTHNSISYLIDNSYLQTQNAYLTKQLTGGIRYIDITCRYKHSHIQVYHGPSETGHRLSTVLEEIFDFLKEHPRETVVLRIQRGGVFSDSKTFFESFDENFAPGTYLGNRAAQYIYTNGADEISLAPTLGELRGKVFILEDFTTERPGRYGLPWNEDTVTSYNHKVSAGGWFIKSKWNDVKSHLSQDPSPGSNKLRITHTTASVGVKPINIAARNRPGFGMNALLGRYLQEPEAKCFGIVVMDFPGKFLVQRIVDLNRKYRVPKAARLKDQYRAPKPSDFPPHHDDLPIPEELVDDINYDRMK